MLYLYCCKSNKFYLNIMKNKRLIWFPVIVSVFTAMGFALGYFGKTSNSNIFVNNDLNKSISAVDNMTVSSTKISQILNYIDKMYIEGIGIDTLTENFIPDILKKLDPHSSYIPAKDALEANENLEGSFDGVGIVFNMVTDTLVVLEVVAGGPASKTGMEMGDKIIKIEKENIAGIKYSQIEVMKKLRGEGGTVVNVSVERKGFDELIEIDVTRGKVAINSLEAALIIKPKLGYLKLLRFSKTTHDEIVIAIDSLINLGMETLILDLTSNSGGYMNQAILLANEFLPKNDLIVSAKARDGRLIAQEFADGTGKFINHKLFVLVDEFSASSSEIVAGAIQDNDRGTIIGRRSYGKGLIQQQIPISGGAVLNLSIARYYTPSGRCIQKPYDMGKLDEYYNDLVKRYSHMEFVSLDSIAVNDSLKYKTKSGRTVYGGGGIIPDLFVPMDTTQASKFLIKAVARINLIKFVTRYAVDNSKEFAKLNSLSKVDAYFKKNETDIYNKYIDFVVSNGVKVTKKEATENKKELLPYLEAYIGQYTPMGANAFYSKMYHLNEITNAAVELAN